MAVKARDQVTVAVAVDVASVDVYYKLQPSTSVAPSKPTTANPDGWTTIEPTYDEESTNTLYTCQKTTLTDGTFYWSAVSKSTAYEASKTAWNLAHNTSQELANLSIGGANLIVFNKTMLGRLDANGEVYASSDGNYHVHTEPISIEGGAPYVLSWFYKVTEYTNSFLYVSWLDTDGEHISRTNVEKITNVEPSYRKFVSPENAAYAVVNIPTHLANKCMAKFEKGSVPSDMSLSVYDATNQPNMLRGTNQPDVLRNFGSDWVLWDDGLWRVQSGDANNGDAEIFEVNDCKDARQRYGFRVWSTSTGNKDIGQGKVPYKARTYYRLVGFVRLTNTSPEQQTSATFQFRVYGSSVMKTYTLKVESNEWTQFAYAFTLNADQAAIGHTTLFGVRGKGSLDLCGLYIHEGYAYRRMSLGEDYLPWQPATEDYALYGSVTSHLSKIDTDFQVLEESIESKVDATDVYTKNTIDGMFSTEVTNRNTAISQTQSAIEQHVSETYSTKIDTTQMAQPNLSPYFIIDTNDVYNTLTNPDGYWGSALPYWTNLTNGWAHVERVADSSNAYANYYVHDIPDWLKPSTEYTFLVEWRNVVTDNLDAYIAVATDFVSLVDAFDSGTKYVNVTTSNGGAYIKVTTLADLSTADIFSRGYAGIRPNSSLVGDFRISFYEGTYSGPYKPYIDQSLTSRVSHAEATLSVHANEIEARVEKDGVIAAINASVEESGGSAVKIQADKVAIDGTAIFTAIKGQTDNAYDVKGAAADVQDNLDNLSIGGRNLLKGTSSIPDSTRVFSRDISCSDAYGWYVYSTKMTITTTENGIKFTHNATTYRDGIVLYLIEENACVGEEDLVLSCEYRTNVSGWYTPYLLNTEAPNAQDDNSMTAVVSTEEWQKGVWKLNFPSTEDNTTLAFLFGYIGIANGWIEIKKNTLKLEKGNTVTDWSPAPEDVNNDISEVRTIANNAAPKSTAIKRTQRIYYRSNSSTPPQTPGITSSDWITQTGDVTEIWTAKHISILETHKYIYTCEQSENNSGTVSYTSVLLDDTITVIDGGKLITGSVKTNSIDAESGTFNTANIPVLTADHIKANVISAVNQGTGRIEADKIDVSSISIGSLSGSESLAHKNLIPQPSYFSNVTDVGDGWIHVKYSNSSTSPESHYWNLHHCDDVEPGKTYTIMLEFRNWTCTTNPTGNYMYLQQIGTYQFWGSNGVRSDGKEEAREKYATYIHYEDVVDGSMCTHIVKVADTEHEPSSTANLFRYRMYTPPQSEMTFDIRWSLYEGDYSGPYNAYIDQSLSSRLSTAEDTIDGHTSSIATIGTKADNALTNASTAVEAANNAAKTATNYVTAIDGKGIWLTPSNEKPDSSGDEVVGTTTGWHISDALDLFHKGISMFKVWLDETTNAVLTRIGGANTGHLLLEQSAIKLCDATGWVGKFDLTTTETAEGFDPIHTVALEVNDGTEQGAHLGLHISHNGTTHRHFVKLGSSSYGVGVDSSGLVGVNASSVAIGPAASMGDDKTFAINDIVHSFGKLLFNGNYSTTKSSTVTLLESAENFYMLRIICEDSSGQHISTDIYEPNNKSFSVTFSVAIPDALYIKSKSYRISGTSISCVQATASGNSYYRHGEAILRASGVTYTTNEVIGIVRVIGFY